MLLLIAPALDGNLFSFSTGVTHATEIHWGRKQDVSLRAFHYLDVELDKLFCSATGIWTSGFWTGWKSNGNDYAAHTRKT